MADICICVYHWYADGAESGSYIWNGVHGLLVWLSWHPVDTYPRGYNCYIFIQLIQRLQSYVDSIVTLSRLDWRGGLVK